MAKKGLTKENEKCLEELAELRKLECNRYCAECGAQRPTWCSTNLGVFVCIQCSGVHRRIGVHISFVKSSTLDAWTFKLLEKFKKQGGNDVVNSIYEAKMPRDVKPNPHTDSYDLEKFIRNKYEHKLWYSKKVAERLKKQSDDEEEEDNDNDNNNGKRKNYEDEDEDDEEEEGKESSEDSENDNENSSDSEKHKKKKDKNKNKDKNNKDKNKDKNKNNKNKNDKSKRNSEQQKKKNENFFNDKQDNGGMSDWTDFDDGNAKPQKQSLQQQQKQQQKQQT